MNTNADSLKPMPNEVQAFFGSVAPEQLERMQKIRAIILEEAPLATERLAYGMPSFYWGGPLVYYAPCKGYTGFYPTPEPILHFKGALKNFKQSKGSIHFPLNKPLPEELIRDIVRYQVERKQTQSKD
ncbi:MAG: DUF1801 domain-containing protein [Anaerolineaceae bacterium]|nr:DUF1801 domain-containing protein [Anaerolineaceae bacterium]